MWVGREDGIARVVPGICPFVFWFGLNGPLYSVVRVKTCGIVANKCMVGVERLPTPLVVKRKEILGFHIIVFVP